MMHTLSRIWGRFDRSFLTALFLFAQVPLVGASQSPSAISDTVALTLDEAEQRFIKENVQLLASRLTVGASRAAIIQARLWNNPNISIEQNIYNQTTKKYLDFTPTGNTGIQIQQLFVLAGKRDKQISLADINAQIAENTFYDLLRALKLELRSDFYDLHFLLQSLRFYDESIPSVGKTVAATERNYQNRSILLSELLRLKALLLTLESERLDISNRIHGIQTDLRILLRDTSAIRLYYVPRVVGNALDSVQLSGLDFPSLLSTALQNRPDYKNAVAAVTYDETNLSLQRALRSPDVTIGGQWSRAGSYIPDYFALTVAVDLPIFNRNQGNIEAAEYTLRSDMSQREFVQQKVEREVSTALHKAIEADRLYRSIDKRFTDQYKTLVDGMIANYENRNTSIIVFTDFYESYRTSMLQMNKIQNDRIDAIETLNYAVGTTVAGGTRH